LCEHLTALDDLPVVLARKAGFGDEAILPVRLHVEKIEQSLNGPRRLR
jgi:hypothetical protein